MDKLALIYGETTLYWSSIMLTLGAAVAVLFFLAFYIGKCGNAVAAFAAVPACLVLGLVFSRFFHWYFRADSYANFFEAMTDYSSGGYALMGVFLGCFLSAALLRLVRLHRSLPEMLDCMAIAGCAGMAVGRLASFFNASGRGNVLETLTFLPFAYPVTNAVSGAQEYRLAVFLFQSVVALVLFVGLTVFYIRGSKRGNLIEGDTALVFLLIYGATQVVMDSNRYDSLFFRSNGFIGVVEVLGALGLALAIFCFSRRMVRFRGFRFWQAGLWLVIAGLIGGACYMEYYVQRRGNEAVFAYSVMSACLVGIVLLTLLIRQLGGTGERKKHISVG